MANSEVFLNLQKFIDEALPEALSKGLEKAGQLVENQAKKNCPVDDGVLRASITHIVDADEGKASIGTNVEYAPFVHDGTGVYNPEGRKTPWKYTTADGETWTSTGQKANPFLQDAIDSNMDEILKVFENLLGE